MTKILQAELSPKEHVGDEIIRSLSCDPIAPERGQLRIKQRW
jgi:hypothetical protein